METRKLFWSILLLLAVLPAVAQQEMWFISGSSRPLAPNNQKLGKYQVEDTAKLVVTYTARIQWHPTDASKTFDDTQILELGKKCTHWYSYNIYQLDSIGWEAYKQKKPFPTGDYPIEPYEIFKYHESNKKTDILTIYRMFVVPQVFYYWDDMKPIDWKFGIERQKVLNIDCQKATCTFRGRTYEAWFALSIPYSHGPFKFAGLPGLILKIEDTQKQFRWEAIGITAPKKEVQIKRYARPYEKISRDKLRKMTKRFYDNPYQLFKSLNIGLEVKDKSMTVNDLKFDYNPIELE